MSRTPSPDERLALAVIAAAEKVVSHEWLKPDGDKTPDLRVVLDDGRSATVEITRNIDHESQAFLESGSKWYKKYVEPSLACCWSVGVEGPCRVKDHGRLRARVREVLSEAEKKGGTTDDMLQGAQKALQSKIINDESLDFLPLDCKSAESGRVRLIGYVTDGYSPGENAIKDAVQNRIEAKENQVAGYEGEKWLVVVLFDAASLQITNGVVHGITRTVGDVDYRCFDQVLAFAPMSESVVALLVLPSGDGTVPQRVEIADWS